jgi:hypothetical protein
MTIFATPDFGASAAVLGFLLLVGAVSLALVTLGVVLGVRLRKSGSPVRRACGVLLLVVSSSIPLCCCLGPPVAVRLEYGNYPLGRFPKNIRTGMSAEEVATALGQPHEQYEGVWIYYVDGFGLNSFHIRFDPDGKVDRTYSN